MAPVNSGSPWRLQGQWRGEGAAPLFEWVVRNPGSPGEGGGGDASIKTGEDPGYRCSRLELRDQGQKGRLMGQSCRTLVAQALLVDHIYVQRYLNIVVVVANLCNPMEARELGGDLGARPMSNR
jgi:hypothetical protein